MIRQIIKRLVAAFACEEVTPDHKARSAAIHEGVGRYVAAVHRRDPYAMSYLDPSDMFYTPRETIAKALAQRRKAKMRARRFLKLGI